METISQPQASPTEQRQARTWRIEQLDILLASAESKIRYWQAEFTRLMEERNIAEQHLREVPE